MTDNDGSLREPHSGTGAAGTKPTTSRRGRADDGSREQLAVPRARFRSYYGRPVLKPPVWEWRIPAYFFAGGLSAGAALLAAGADLTGRPALRRAGRLGGFAGLLASLYLLIADLGRPERFHYMLRVVKPSSPMSVGTWTLTAYGPGSGLAAAAELLPLSLRVASAKDPKYVMAPQREGLEAADGERHPPT
jgi:polysulfide reductase-like protein